MIVCHSRKFVLIRPRKVASSSVQWALMPHLQAGDLVMRVDNDDLDIAPGTAATIGNIRRWPRVLRGHSPVSRLIKVLGSDLLSYRIVTLARNPWDRAVSEFYFACRDTNMKSRPAEVQRQAFAAYVRNQARMSPLRRLLDRLEGRQRQSKMVQSELCVVQGKFVADQVIFFEDLQRGLEELGGTLGLDIRLPDQQAKGAIRASASRDWRSFHTDETRDLIARCCAADIELYGYDFDGRATPGWSRASCQK